MGWLIAVAALVVAGLYARRYAPHIPLYLTNLRLRAKLSRLDEAGLGERLLIVAPHPDDETLGCGGLIQRAVDRGTEVFVALMTNGEGFRHEWALMKAEDVVLGKAEEHLRLGRMRQRESLKALAEDGIPPDHVICLGYPDGGVHAMWQPSYWSVDQPYRSPRTQTAQNPYASSLSPGAPYSGAQVLKDLQTVLEWVRPTAVFTTPPFDVQRDHWATYDFVRLALTQHALQTGKDISLYCFLIHRHDWPAPQGFHPREPLEPPVHWLREPGVQWLMLPLTLDQLRQKTDHLGDYKTQAALESPELTSFLRANELFAQLRETLPASEVGVIEDPVGDLPPDWVHPAQDIAAVGLSVGTVSAELSITLAGRPTPALRYAVVWHSVEASPPQAGCFIWRDGQGVIRESASQGKMSELLVECQVRPKGLTASVPKRLFPEGAVMFEGYSQRGGHYLNHTMTVILPPATPQWASAEEDM